MRWRARLLRFLEPAALDENVARPRFHVLEALRRAVAIGPADEVPALPALMAIHASGLADVMPALDLQGQPVELVLRAYKPGSYATLEARTGSRHFAVKICAQQPAEEAAVYEALATAGLAGQSGVGVPPLLAWARERRMLVSPRRAGRAARRLGSRRVRSVRLG